MPKLLTNRNNLRFSLNARAATSKRPGNDGFDSQRAGVVEPFNGSDDWLHVLQTRPAPVCMLVGLCYPLHARAMSIILCCHARAADKVPSLLMNALFAIAGERQDHACGRHGGAGQPEFANGLVGFRVGLARGRSSPAGAHAAHACHGGGPGPSALPCLGCAAA